MSDDRHSHAPYSRSALEGLGVLPCQRRGFHQPAQPLLRLAALAQCLRRRVLKTRARARQRHLLRPGAQAARSAPSPVSRFAFSRGPGRAAVRSRGLRVPVAAGDEAEPLELTGRTRYLAEITEYPQGICASPHVEKSRRSSDLTLGVHDFQRSSRSNFNPSYGRPARSGQGDADGWPAAQPQQGGTRRPCATNRTDFFGIRCRV